jgi:hypothetical protein
MWSAVAARSSPRSRRRSALRIEGRGGRPGSDALLGRPPSAGVAAAVLGAESGGGPPAPPASAMPPLRPARAARSAPSRAPCATKRARSGPSADGIPPSLSLVSPSTMRERALNGS